MKYQNIVKGKFVDRPNRFIAHVEIEGVVETVHVKNTGRCKELLQPGCDVYLEKADEEAMKKRKTQYDLVTANKNGRLINMDSQLPNVVAYEWLDAHRKEWHIAELKREVTFGNSRFDLWGKKEDGQEFFIEVKGVTLEQDNVVSFPDAPTTRGLKHVAELMKALDAGYEAGLLFVVQMKDVDYFMPNFINDLPLATGIQRAAERGVRIMAYDCCVTEDEVYICQPVDVQLDQNP